MFVNQIDCLVCHIPKIHFNRRQRRLIIFSLFFAIIAGHDNVFRDTDSPLTKDVTDGKCHIVIGADDCFRPFSGRKEIITGFVSLVFPKISIEDSVFSNLISIFFHDPFKAGKTKIRIVPVFWPGHKCNILRFMHFDHMTDNFLHRISFIQ